LLSSVQGHHYPEINPERGPPSPQGATLPHMRRKSVLPVDPTVVRDLQAHRSLDDGPLR
jgi:serine/threonine-protein phosphatase 2A regulatory subunit B'